MKGACACARKRARSTRRTRARRERPCGCRWRLSAAAVKRWQCACAASARSSARGARAPYSTTSRACSRQRGTRRGAGRARARGRGCAGTRTADAARGSDARSVTRLQRPRRRRARRFLRRWSKPRCRPPLRRRAPGARRVARRAEHIALALCEGRDSAPEACGVPPAAHARPGRERPGDGKGALPASDECSRVCRAGERGAPPGARAAERPARTPRTPELAARGGGWCAGYDERKADQEAGVESR
jgi:hypothetical protein